MNYSIEQLRKQYFESIMMLTSEEDIMNILPQPGYDSFYPIMNGLIELIKNEMQVLQEELNTLENDDELIELSKEEMKLLQLKKDVCQKLIEQAIKTRKSEEEVQDTDRINLIFATTEMGNVYVERDLKNISSEYHASIVECLKKIEEGIDEKNPEKAKKLHYDLLGMHEIKDDNVRVYYKKLAPDTAYVVMFKIKKSDFGKSVHNEVLSRNRNIDGEYMKLKEEINNPLKKEELINSNKEIRDRIYGIINENRRGRNV